MVLGALLLAVLDVVTGAASPVAPSAAAPGDCCFTCTYPVGYCCGICLRVAVDEARRSQEEAALPTRAPSTAMRF